jgi:hypothetical protein
MGTRAMTMDVSGLPDWLVSLCTGVGGIGVAFLGLRKYLRADAVDHADTKARVTTTDLMRLALEEANKRAEEANKRAENLLRALEGAHSKINELNNHVFQLEVQVRRMRQQLDEIAPRSDTLQTGPTP